ncbi:hypothetical protein [Criblamydia sequanensis]|uniref:Uncharacterized protein n=1 Tax=Candidatus Criblamydia sequanensis CRIB-18 TaxID=1437425 RepID=A0A090D0H0_9BACT|nr:hypothetical protein [Criblamydia sequanensis]CDR33325.1 Conserved hypothetical protein [Criblamydia sequanensis CRIB-18]
MATRSKSKPKPLTIVEAIETLSSIADMSLDKEMGIAEKQELIIGRESVPFRTIHWLNKEDGATTIKLVRETFRVVLDYLKNFYEEKFINEKNGPALEGIKTIMVLVGEAAKKLDRFTNIFMKSQAGSVMQLKEFRDLQHFYKTRVSQKIDESVLGKWILGIVKQLPKKEGAKLSLKGKQIRSSKYAFVDLENVKKDIDYELFYIRKEDGTRFISPRLIRNMKLVSDFGETFWDNKGEDPLRYLSLWQDRLAKAHAEAIIHSLKGKVGKFFKEISKMRTKPLINELSSALMALILASKESNLITHNPIKSCQGYFIDFQEYLSSALCSREYQTQNLYPVEDSSSFELISEICQALTKAFFIENRAVIELGAVIEGLLHAALLEKNHQKDLMEKKTIGKELKDNYEALKKILFRHPGGPLTQMLTSFEEGELTKYEPLKQKNWPTQLFSLIYRDKNLSCLRLPPPICQEYIHKASILDEFTNFIVSCNQEADERKHLYINLQDRTSWKEFARAAALENFQNDPKVREVISVLTLPIDTDFYHQNEEQEEIRKAPLFISHFLELLKDESAGFFIPEELRKDLNQKFFKQLLEAVHRIFFHGKNILTKDERIIFIDLAYLLIELKAIDILQPDSFNLSCKDALDGGMAASSLLFLFMKLLSHNELSSLDLECLHFMVFGPQLLIRERVMLQDRFSRFIGTVHWLEETKNDFGKDNFCLIIKEAFGPLFPNGSLELKPLPLQE